MMPRQLNYEVNSQFDSGISSVAPSQYNKVHFYMQQTFNHAQKVGFLSRRASKNLKQGRKGYAPLMQKVNQTIDLLIDESGEEPV